MTVIRSQIEFAHSSGLAQDKVVNVLHWLAVAPDYQGDSSLAKCTTVITTAIATIDQNLASSLATSGHQIKYYDLSEDKPRQPLRTDTFSLSTKGSETSPQELALCLSYHAEYESGMNAARRKGRVYLGPWNTAGASDATGRPSSSYMTAVLNYGIALLASTALGGEMTWCTYSPTIGGTGATAAAPVVAVWVDNEWDIQRRRGRKPTTRLSSP